MNRLLQGFCHQATHFRVWEFLWMLALVCVLGTGASSEPVRAVATTTIVGDVVGSIAGDLVELTVLLPVGADPHGYRPAPRDVVAVSEANAVFLSGAGLEDDIRELLENATGPLVDLSRSVALRRLEISDGAETADGEETSPARHVGDVDRHVWFDPTNVMIWTRVVEEALAEIDPENAERYAANAAAYRAELSELDLWIWEQVSRIPWKDRVLVSDHVVFGYFSARYGFTQAGAIFPGLSTLAEPSARELANLVDALRSLDTGAIFVGSTIPPTLVQSVAADTGVQIVRLYTGSLSNRSGPAGTYLAMMRFDVSALVEALSRSGSQ